MPRERLEVEISANADKAIQSVSVFRSETQSATTQLDALDRSMLRFAGEGVFSSAKQSAMASDLENSFLRFANVAQVIPPRMSAVGSSINSVTNKIAKLGAASSNAVRDFVLLEKAGQGGLRSLAGGFGLVSSGAAAAGIAIGGVVLAAKQVVELGRLGAQAITAKSSFDLMMASVNASTDEINQMRVAAQGTISDLKLFEMASYSVIGVEGEVGNAIANANDQLITIARAAFKARPSLESVEFAYQSLVDGIKRVEKRLVDNLGLQVKAREANERYAESVGKSVDELTAQEVQLAFLNEVLRAGGVLVQQVGGDVGTMQDAFARASVAATNLKVAIGEQLAPAIVEATNAWANFLTVIGNTVVNTPQSKLDNLNIELEALKKTLSELRAQAENPPPLGGWGADIIEGIFGEDALQAFSQTFQKAISAWVDFTGATTTGERAIQDTEKEILDLEERLRIVAMVEANAARVTREYAEDNSLLEAAIRTVNAAMFSLIGTARDFADKQASVLDKAQKEYDKTLGTTVRSLASLGASFEFAATKGEEQAQQIRELTWLYEQGKIGVVEFNYFLGLLDKDLSSVRDSFKETGGEIDGFTEKLQGLVSLNLEPSFKVDDLAPGLSVREDEVDEHYRRLAAIALRGQEELDKHQTDWADTLAKIPEDVKAKGIEAIKAWAKEKVIAYDKGLDFSLINRDTIKKRIMEALLSQEMKNQLVDEITAEMKGAVSEAQVEAAAASVLGGTPLGQITLGGVTFGPSKEPPDMSAVAGQINAELSKAFKDVVNSKDIVLFTAQSINSADKKPIELASRSVGETMLTGITDAVTSGAPDIINKLAEKIAPSVKSMIDRDNRRSGQQP